MNKYQKIIRGGKELQPGSIDTHAKFRELTHDVNFIGKIVTDLGCNSGEMCRLAKQAGAKHVTGLDKTLDFLIDARRLNPDIKFVAGNEHQINGHNDIIIASAMFHYVRDHDYFFKRMAKCTRLLLMDVWLADEVGSSFQLSHRNSYIPTRLAFENIVSKYFNKIIWKGKSITPDGSNRFTYHISEPRPSPSKALLLYGTSNTGKTTMAKEHEAIGYHRLSTDKIFMAFYNKYNSEIEIPYSVRHFVDNMSDKTKELYLKFHDNHIKRWLSGKVGHDVVIEGYDMINDDYRRMVKLRLDDWSFEIKHLTKVWS